MEKRNLRSLAAAVAIAIIAAGAGAYVLAQPKDDAVRIGVLPVIDTLPLYAAQEQGLFEKAGVKVKLVPFNSAAECIEAFKAHEIDGFFGDMIKTLILKGSGQDVKVVTTVHHTSDRRMFALLAPPGEGEMGLEDIGGMKVATSTGTIAEYLLDEMLADAPSDVEKVEVPQIRPRMESLNAGMLTFLPEPLVTEAVRDYGAREVANDTAYSMATSIIAMRESFVSGNLNLTKSFLGAYNESVTLVNLDPLRFAGILKERFLLSGELLDAFEFPPLSEPKLPSRDEFQRVQDWTEAHPGSGAQAAGISYESIMATELYG